jgi:hypothetical protein
MPKLRNGHAPSHLRETAGDAFLAWMDWDGTSPEPAVLYETNSRACGLIWNCTDIVPGLVFHGLRFDLEAVGQVVRRQTYSA